MINLVNHIDLSDWKTKNQIVFELHRDWGINISKDGREWREAVEKWNKAFINHEVPFYITHSNNMGYKATIDYQEAKMARNDYVKALFHFSTASIHSRPSLLILIPQSR